jgi:hypothetical protein
VSLILRREVTYARANWGRWVADCPSPFCLSALQLQRYQPWFACLECDTAGEIVWPDRAEDVERILSMRPDPFTRNWSPGESLQDLYLENLDHGALPVPLEQLASHQGLVFEVADERILIDRAPLPSVRRYEIED